VAAVRPAAISIDQLAPHYEREHFSCGVEALDRYLRQQAGQDVRKNAAAAFVLTEPPSPAVLGFYTLAATSILLTELPEATAKKMPRYPQVPSILLGRLAVDQCQRGRGLGALLLIDAIQRSLAIDSLGWAVLVVDAKDEAAGRFYERFGFLHLTREPRRMFLPRATLAQL